MECTFKGDDAIALGMAIGRMIFARHFDGTFHRLGTRIGKEHRIGKSVVGQPLGQLLAFGNMVEVGNMPQLLALGFQGLDQMRMRMAERIHRNPCGKIQIAVTLRRDEPRPLSSLEGEIYTRKSRQQRRQLALSHDGLTFWSMRSSAKINCRPTGAA